jgi:hypothetical protein
MPTIEEFATALEDKWKVGKKGTDKRRSADLSSLNPAEGTWIALKLGTGWKGSCRMGRWETSAGRCSRFW